MRKFLQLVSWMVVGGLLIGAVGLVVFATPLLGNRALIVRSGSMEPTIAVGDIVIVRAGEYQPGEAIAYTMPGRENVVVTHRIVEVKDGAYITKGDANAEADSWLVNEADIIGNELFVVPWVGHVLAFAKTKAGFVSLVLLPALGVILSEARVIWREVRKKVLLDDTPPDLPSHEGRKEKYSPSSEGELEGVLSSAPPVRRYLDGLSARVAVIVLMAAIMTPATWALYSDSATSTNNVFAAAEDFGTGPGDIVINEIMWMGSTASSQDEWLELRNLTSNPVDLANWSIVNAGAGASPVITLTGTIPANGYFLISARLSTHAQSALNNSLIVDQQDSNISFDNNGEQLTLKNNTEAIIDQTPVAPGWPAGFHDSGDLEQSMARNSTSGDGTVAGNWHTCTDAVCNDTTYWDVEGANYGTPKASNL